MERDAFAIGSIRGLEILDSRGRPTVEVQLAVQGGPVVVASVPSGASTGCREAVELRDGDRSRYDGSGVLRVVGALDGEIADAMRGLDVRDQEAIDRRLVALDGTPDKSRLGANAILAVSLATAKAGAAVAGLPLFRWLSGDPAARDVCLPMPCMNVLNGGKHADSSLDFQEFMLVPVGAPTFAEAMRYGAQTYAALKATLADRGLGTGVGDEGGFAPRLEGNEAACGLIVEAIERAGFSPGRDVAIALDPAATSFASEDGYDLERSGEGRLDRDGLLRMYERWLSRWPIVSIEDGFAEDDWEGFEAQTRLQGERIQIVGDDCLVTNAKLIREAMARGACNAALIKPNQIGTVTETIAAIRLCQAEGWGTMVSHRSGETTDSFIADLAVGLGCGQIKSGAPCRGERLAKYNRLIAIEASSGRSARLANPFASRPAAGGSRDPHPRADGR